MYPKQQHPHAQKKKSRISAGAKRIWNTLVHDARLIYKRHPQIARTTIFLLALFLIFVWVKPLLILFVFIIIDRIVVFFERHTSFALKIEHVTIASVLIGYYIGVVYALIAAAVLMFILQHRNIKLTFLGVLIDGTIWILAGPAAFFMKSIGLSITFVAFSIPIARFLIKLAINITLGFAPHDLHKDSFNMVYQIVFIRYIGPILIGILT